MIGAKRKAESGLGTDDIVQQALREKEAEKEAKRQLKDPTGTVAWPNAWSTCMPVAKLQGCPLIRTCYNRNAWLAQQ